MSIIRTGVGSRMSETVIHNGVIYLAGQVGNGATVKEQTADMLNEIDKLLAAAGSSKSNILSVTLWLSEMSNFEQMNSVWDAWIDPKNPPARACGEAKLATPDYLVEAIVIAAVG